MPDATNERLFEEFSAATLTDWQQEAERSIRGKPLSGLVRNTAEGFAIEPIYGPDTPSPHVSGAAPGHSPYVRGTKAEPGWSLCQAVQAADAVGWNRLAREELDAGASGLVMALGNGGLALTDSAGMNAALAGLDLNQTELVFEAGVQAPCVAALIGSCGGGQLQGSLGFDPLGTLVATGEMPAEITRHLDEAADLVRWCRTEAPGLTAMSCSGLPYHDGGASAVQELAFVLATGVEYLRALVDRGVEADQAAQMIDLSFCVGSRMLMEVAKLRAARLVWSVACDAFGVRAGGARIHAYTSRWTQSARDPWVNLLRATVQTFAAVVGGAQRVTVVPFDAAIGSADPFSRRLARNTQIILRDESFLHRVTDPAGGSWALETLTYRLGRESWELLQEVERRGGMAAALQEGFVQGDVARIADQRRQSVATRTESFVGVSLYPDLAETPRDTPPRRAVEVSEGAVDPGCAAALDALRVASREPPDGSRTSSAVEAARNGASLTQLAAALREGAEASQSMAVSAWRGMEDFERIRDVADAHRDKNGGLPSALLVSWGDAARLRLRSDWAAGALRVGGFQVEPAKVCGSPAEAREVIEGSSAAVLLICAEDEAAYAEGLPLLRGSNGKTPMVVASPPPPGEPVWAQGVAFLHRKADLVAILSAVHQELWGVNR